MSKAIEGITETILEVGLTGTASINEVGNRWAIEDIFTRTKTFAHRVNTEVIKPLNEDLAEIFCALKDIESRLESLEQERLSALCHAKFDSAWIEPTKNPNADRKFRLVMLEKDDIMQEGDFINQTGWFMTVFGLAGNPVSDLLGQEVCRLEEVV